MSETDTNGFSSEELTTSDWWIHQISDVPNWGPGGVFLVCTGPFASVTAAGAWFHTATGLFTEKMEKSFSEIVLIVPPGTKQLNYRDRFKASLKFSFERTGTEIPGDLLRYLDAADWPWVQSDAERVLERLQGLPQMSAVAIAGAERLRFQKLERVPGTLTSTHTGLRVSHSSADDLLLPHLHELLRQLLKLAKDHRLSIVVLVENFEYEPRKLPDDLRSHPELAVVSTRYSEAERSRYRATIEALEISRTSGLEAATQFVRQNISDVDRQAHAISYLYSNCGLWTQAWDVLDGHIAVLRNSKEPNVLLNMAQAAGGCGEAKSACELLNEAFELGFETIESFNAAAILAKSIGAAELLDQIIAEMRIAYPRHPMTVACAFGRLMTTAKYNEAAEMADAVGAKFDAFYGFMHGGTNGNTIGTVSIGISAKTVGAQLGNTNGTFEGKNAIFTHHPYNFVFLDGCNTALGDFPEAFGIPKVVSGGQVNDLDRHRRAFMGWTGTVEFQFDPSHIDWTLQFWTAWLSGNAYNTSLADAINTAYNKEPSVRNNVPIRWYGNGSLTWSN